jgi:hypothetical protein
VKISSTIGLLIVIGIGAYIYSINRQISDIEVVCSLFPEGTAVGDLKEIENKYSVKLMGPLTSRINLEHNKLYFVQSLPCVTHFVVLNFRTTE